MVVWASKFGVGGTQELAIDLIECRRLLMALLAGSAFPNSDERCVNAQNGARTYLEEVDGIST